MKRWLLGTLVVCLAAPPASAGGINLSWNDCGVAGTMVQTFACDVNTGTPFTLYGSFVPPPGIDEFLGISAQVDLCTMGWTFTDWWAHGAGQCRGTGALVLSLDFTEGPFSCADVYFGQAAGGYAYDVGYGTPARARLRIQCAVPIDNRLAVDPSTEYYAFKVSFARSKSTGTGSCAGCSTPACIILNSVQLFQPPEQNNDPEISNPVNTNYAYWQSAPPGCPLSVPVANATWGQIRSRYR